MHCPSLPNRSYAFRVHIHSEDYWPFRQGTGGEIARDSRSKQNVSTSRPELVKTYRRKFARRFVQLAGRVQPLQQLLDSVIDEESPSKNLKIPLIAFLAKGLKYGDTYWPIGLAKGLRITGAIPPSKVHAGGGTASAARWMALRSGVRARNRATPKSITNTRGQTIRSNRSELSWGEYIKGCLSKPEPISRSDLSNLAISPLFCIAEQNGLHRHKYRAIGDLSRHLVNSAVDAVDAYFPPRHRRISGKHAFNRQIGRR